MLLYHAKTENNPKSSSVKSSPIHIAKKTKNSGLFTQKKVDSPQSNSFIETKHHEVHFSSEKHESPLPPKIKPNTKDILLRKSMILHRKIKRKIMMTY